MKNLVNTYLDRDIVSFLQITDTIKFRKLVTAISIANGGFINMTEMLNQIGSYFKGLAYLMDVLEQMYIIRRIPPYHANLPTELRKTPKVYFVDTGLRNSLIDSFSDMDHRADSGTLAENFVMNELIRSVQLHFWRTTSKAEVDFVTQGTNLTPVEVKFKHLV